MHGERRRLLVMKGTEPGKILGARLLEFDVVTDDANDVGLLLEGVFEVGSGHGSVGRFYCGARVRQREMARRPCGGSEKLWINEDRGGGSRKKRWSAGHLGSAA